MKENIETDLTNHVVWVKINKIFKKMVGQLPTLPLRLLWPDYTFISSEIHKNHKYISNFILLSFFSKQGHGGQVGLDIKFGIEQVT